MKIYPNQLDNTLKQGLQPCYLIVGDEPLQQQEAIDKIRQKAKTEGYTEREVLHVDKKFKWEMLFASMGTMSLFAEKKIMELYLPTGKPGTAGSKAIIQFVENIPFDICFIIRCDQWTAANDKTKWVKTFEKYGSFMRVYMPAGNDFYQWLRNRCQLLGLAVQNDAITLLALRLEGNLLAAAQELEKLKMRFGTNSISAKDIAGLVADNARFDVFRLNDTLLENNLLKSLKIIRGLQQNNTAVTIIHWALERQTRMLCYFAELNAKGQRPSLADYRKHGIWQKQQNTINSVVNRLNINKLHRLVKEMAELDRICKGQAQGDPWLAIEKWCVNFCQ